MLLQRPTNHSSAERIKQNCQERKLFQQSNIGNIRHPELIEAGWNHAACEVRHHRPLVARIRRYRHKRTRPQAQQIVLSHQPKHAFEVNRNAMPIKKLPPYPPISITAVRKGHALHDIADRCLFLPWRRCSPLAVVASAAYSRELAQPLDRRWPRLGTPLLGLTPK